MSDLSQSSSLEADVCVIGGGPAGAALALRLRQLGYSVVVIEKQPFPRPHVGESLLKEVLQLLEVLGVRPEVESAGFLRPQGTIVRWTDAVEWRPSGGDFGFQVDRGRFDEILLQAARNAGAQILQPARALQVKQPDQSVWRTTVRSVAGRMTVTSRFLADASGQTGFLPSRRLRSSPNTVALYAYWHDVPCRRPDTRIEAGEDEWYWGAPLPGNAFNAAVFIDRSRYKTSVAAAGGRDAFYVDLITHSALLTSCLQGSRRGPVHICDATQSHHASPVTRNAIKVGEASFSIDPLSSQGVQSALGSALHAAAVINTILRRPEDSALAIEFYKNRQTHSIHLHAAAAARIYHQAALSRPGAFWQKRAALAVVSDYPKPVRPTLDLDTEVRWAPGVKLGRVPTIQGDYVVSTSALLSSTAGNPIAFLDGTAIGPLAAMIQTRQKVDQILRLWHQRVPPRRATEIVRWLWDAGFLLPASD